MAIEFDQFPKIPRYRRQVAITEKIDGTNAAVRWEPHDFDAMNPHALAIYELTDQHGTALGTYELMAQSRQRFISPTTDNYGFAKWVVENKEDLRTLGPGTHFGEWWGYGIQRGYGVPEKRFSLFNVNRWRQRGGCDSDVNPLRGQEMPGCCHVVPLMGYFEPHQISEQLERLRADGSLAAPGYQRPEGIIVWHSQSKQYYKLLIENDDIPKSLAEAA